MEIPSLIHVGDHERRRCDIATAAVEMANRAINASGQIGMRPDAVVDV